jgi:chromosome segregation ATPase
MSDGKFFNLLDSQQSDSDRISELERLWPFIRKKVQEYEQVISEFNSVKPLIQILKKEIVEHCEKQFDQFSQELKSLRSFLQENMKENQLECKAIKKELSESVERELSHHDSSSKFIKKFDDVEKRLEKILNSHGEIENLVVKKHDLETHAKYSKEAHENIFQRLKYLESLPGKQERISENIKLALETVENKISESNRMIGSQNSKMSAIEEKCQSSHDSLKNELRTSFDNLSEWMDSKILQSKNEAKNPIPLIDLAKNEIYKKMEAMEFDSKNAILKSNNCSQQIAILEKKMENLSLLFKKMELDKASS